MKWSDLTREQQEFLLELDDKYPMPDGATHFDMDDASVTGWMRFHNGFFYCCGSADAYCTEDSEEALEDFVQIPDKPWSDSEEEPMQDSNIGKWFRVNVPSNPHHGSVGECIEEVAQKETLLLKFSHLGSMYWSLSDLVLCEESQEKALVKQEPSGSANSYYWVEIPLDRVKIDDEKGVVGFMLEQYLKYGLDNDFDRCNLAKANHRIGRKGNSKEYEIGKMHYYVDQIDKNFEEGN